MACLSSLSTSNPNGPVLETVVNPHHQHEYLRGLDPILQSILAVTPTKHYTIVGRVCISCSEDACDSGGSRDEVTRSGVEASQVPPHRHGVYSATYGVSIAGARPGARCGFSVPGVVGRLVAAPALRRKTLTYDVWSARGACLGLLGVVCSKV